MFPLYSSVPLRIFRPVFKYLERMTGHNFVLKILSRMRVRLFQRLETQDTYL